MLAPAKTPQEIADRLAQEIAAMLKLSDVQGKLRSVGFEALSGSPEALRQRIAQDLPPGAT